MTVLVLVAEGVAARLKLNVIGTSQVMVTALLVLTTGGSTSLAYGWARVAETVVGALVGVGVNALLVPPSSLGTARSLTTSLVASLSNELGALAIGLPQEGGLTVQMAVEELERAREIARQFADSLAALARAERLRFNTTQRGAFPGARRTSFSSAKRNAAGDGGHHRRWRRR